MPLIESNGDNSKTAKKKCGVNVPIDTRKEAAEAEEMIEIKQLLYEWIYKKKLKSECDRFTFSVYAWKWVELWQIRNENNRLKTHIFFLLK